VIWTPCRPGGAVGAWFTPALMELWTERGGIIHVMAQNGDTVRTTGEAIIAGWIPGRPAGKPSARGGARGRRANVWAMASRPVKLWRAAVERQAAEAIDALGGLDVVGGLMGESAIGVSLKFVFPSRVADRWGTTHEGKPDIDNLQKLLFDVWRKAGLLGGLDDASVSAVEAVKVWGAVGGAGYTVTRLERAVIGGAIGVTGRGAGAAPWWTQVPRETAPGEGRRSDDDGEDEG
jgi:Holliday junction resolvase RusA-like endonuclease